MFKKENFSLFSILNIVSCIVLCLAVCVSFKLIFSGRSLWLDEAMLAYSFSTRSITELTSDIFAWNQSAPVLYLYIVKIITLIFGNSEITLRIWSFISYGLLLLGLFFFLKISLKSKLALPAIALVANLAVMIRYSNEFKPYESDALAVISVVIMYTLFREKRLNLICLALFSMIIIWFSNPTCFFLAAMILLEFKQGIIEKDRTILKSALCLSICVGLSFVIYYFYWLKPVIDAGDMTSYWANNNFPLIPTSISDISLAYTLLRELLSPLGAYQLLVLVVVLTGSFSYLFVKTDGKLNIILLGIVIVFFASMIGRYPISVRLWLFIYPLLILLFICFWEKLLVIGNSLGNRIVCLVLLLFVLSPSGILMYWKDKSDYINGEEINLAIRAVEERMRQGDFLYVYPTARPTFLYKNNYDTISFAGYRDNLIVGKLLQQDIDRLIKLDSTYILTSHVMYNLASLEHFLDTLKRYGKVSIVDTSYETSVYYFENNKQIQE